MKTKEVVINTCYGGFGLSDLAYEELAKMGVPVEKYSLKDDDKRVIFDDKLNPDSWYNEAREKGLDDPILVSVVKKPKKKVNSVSRYWSRWFENHRDDPLLISVVKKLKKKANDEYSCLKIVKIPADIDYIIEDDDGKEWISEKHRTWE